MKSLVLVLVATSCSSAQKLRVFVLAGQSNMEGQAEVSTVNKTTGAPLNGTLKYQLTDPRTAALFAPTWDSAANDWAVLDDVKVWFNEAGSQQGINGSVIPGTAGVDASCGSLTGGFGCGASKNLIGPEYGFGFGMHAGLGLGRSGGDGGGDKIVIVKTAWGGKTLAGDFRPPSAAADGAAGRDPYCAGAYCSQTGHFYDVMLADVAKLMAPGVLGSMFPDTAALTPEIAGFGWFQGWNDGCDLNQTAAYEANMVHLIRDLRAAWRAPSLAVSIAVAGFDGFTGEEATRAPAHCWDDGSDKTTCNCAGDRGCRRLDVVLSQFAAVNATRHPELNGHAIAMETRGFWREARFSPNKGQGYHYWHNAETYFLVGQAMAKGMLQMLE
jgi:hypothetical protein